MKNGKYRVENKKNCISSLAWRFNVRQDEIFRHITQSYDADVGFPTNRSRCNSCATSPVRNYAAAAAAKLQRRQAYGRRAGASRIRRVRKYVVTARITCRYTAAGSGGWRSRGCCTVRGHLFIIPSGTESFCGGRSIQPRVSLFLLSPSFSYPWCETSRI